MPNLAGPNDPAESLGVIYRAISGEIEFDVPVGSAVPWVGLYSANGIFANSSDQRDIATRIQYGYNVHESPSLGPIVSPRASRDALLANLTVVASNESYEPTHDNMRLVYIPIGDINGDESVDVADIDQLTAEILDGNAAPTSDLNQDGEVDVTDRDVWVHEIMSVYYGDANLDGLFDSTDLSAVFQAGEYFDNVPGNSTWATGDWNGDKEFNSGDLVAAFKDNGYEKGPRPKAAAVPESIPSFVLIAVIGLLVGGRRGAD